MTWQEALRAI